FVVGLLLFILLSSCTKYPLPDLAAQRSPLPQNSSRTIEHAMGKSQVPINPQRVVVVDTAALDASLALDVKPVGSVIYEQFPDYLGSRTDGIESVGDGNQPNLETILRLNPDLILGSKVGSKRLYKNLNRVAPTVFSEGSGRAGDWQENFTLFAQALNKEQQGRQLLQDYKDKAAALNTQSKDVSETVVSIVATAQGKVGVFSVKSFAGSILQDIGVDRPKAQQKPKRHAAFVSREDLESLDGDIIFLVRDQRSDTSLDRQAFVSDPIWAKLKAVKRDRIYEVSNQVWSAGRNILAAQEILKDLDTALSAENQS
ncbi:MAG: iron-siderophore ABC transporter substrate-binding protein, partial [Cyanobacteria bacterium P01_A01_bin.17]